MNRKPRENIRKTGNRLEIQYLPIADLRRAKRNARTHSNEQISQLARSITEFGWTNPILIDEENTVIAGHGRLSAAESLGLTSVPTITLAGLTDPQKRALVIADNKLALNAGWDEELLRIELTDLQAMGADSVDLGLAGFSEVELLRYLGPSGASIPNEEWQGMPEFEQSKQGSYRSIVVHFADQDAVNQFEALMPRPMGKSVRYFWFPLEIQKSYADKRYES